MSLCIKHLSSYAVTANAIFYAVRMENFVSKYFLEHVIPCFDPLLARYNWGAVVTRICLCIKSIFLLIELIPFKLHLGRGQRGQVPDFQSAKTKSKAFPYSADAAALKRLFPYQCLWNRNAAWIKHSWLKMGTCFGQSLTAMKYHNYCVVPNGFSTADLGSEALLYQAIHLIQAQFQSVLDAKKLLKSHGIVTQDLSSKKEVEREAWLFHYLRNSGISRSLARFLAEQYQELFLLPLQKVQNIVDSFPDIYRDVVLETTNERIDFTAHSSESDVDVCRFLLQNSGVFILNAFGNCEVGHAMFLKIEEGKCLTYDPATEECFIELHTVEGIGKTLKLMKRIIGLASVGGAVSYKVNSLH